MKGKYVVLMILSVAVSFAAGIGVHIGYVEYCEASQIEEQLAEVEQMEPVVEEQIRIRVNNGYVEWSDGTVWNRGEAVEVLRERDPYYIAEQAFKAFEENYRTELDSENQTTIEAELAEKHEIHVGVEKKTTTSTGTTNTGGSSSTVTSDTTVWEPTDTYIPPAEPVVPADPVAPPQPETPVTPPLETPVVPESPAEPSTPETPDAGTGDGEDIGWSDDYL